MPTAINNNNTSSTDLVGRIYYNISKDNHITNDNIDSKKRPRSWESGVAADGGSQRGFIFIPNKTTQLALSSIYPQYRGHELFHIVIPYPFLQIACHAVSTGKTVRISQYSLIQYINGWGELTFSSSRSNKGKTSRTDIEVIQSTSNTINNFMTIEIHQHGFCLVSSADGSEEEEEEEDTNMQDDLPTLTLDDFSQKEWESTLLSSSSGSKSKKKKPIAKDPMSVSAVVDAISPILVNDSSNEEPFAIIELYQLLPNNNDVRSAVAIIRGEQALCMHPAIHPGQSITLVGVVSRKWRVPEVLHQKYYSNTADKDEMDKRSDLYTRLEHRVPDRVLVVTEASSIRWNDKYGMTKRLDDILSLPSTVVPLTSIRGIVKSVHYHLKQSKNGKKKNTHVAHFVTLKSLSSTKEPDLEEEKLIRIYLPKYPLPPDLLMGLQTGCIIRAVNVHCICPLSNTEKCKYTNQADESFQCYVACLRSTIAIERCAGESYHRLSSHPRFVPPQGKAFSMVPDHQITDICSGPFGTKSSEQYFVEEKLRYELESKLDDDESNSQDVISSAHPASTKVDVLLEHHHITATLEMSRSNQVNGRSHTKRRSNKVNNGEHGRQSARDPYAEFFDHAHNKAVSHDTECGSSCNQFLHYNHFYNSTPTSVPLVVELEDLRNACAHNFVNRIRISLQSKQGRAGQTSSHHFRGLNLCQVLNDYSQSQSTYNGQAKTWYDVSNESTPNFYVCGSVEQVGNAMMDNSEMSSTSFSDKRYTIPVCEMHRDTTNGCRFEVNGSSWMNLDSVIVSCLCLGATKKEYEVTESEDSYTQQLSVSHTHIFLPSKKPNGTDNSKMASDTSGHVFIFTADNLAFIASVHLTAKSFVSMDPSNVLEAKAVALKTLSKPRESTKHTSNHTCDLMSVQECLEQTTLVSNSLSEKPISIIGRLIRKRFGFRKLKQNCYEGWSIVISHIDHQSAGHISVLQTIEVRISVPLTNDTQATGSETLKLALNRLSSDSIAPDQVTMGLAFWSASESSKTLPLLSGGWDEGGGLLADQNTIQPSVCLKIPYTSRHFAKLGYQRFRCNLNEMKSYFVYSETGSLSNSGANEHSDDLGTGKFLPGMLTRRLRRMPPQKFKIPEATDSTLHCRNSHSPLISLKCNGGVPSVTLAQLHWDICAALKEGNHAHLKPSLLRRIHNPKILGISFCRARVECTQCFQALSRGSASSKGGHHQNSMSSSSLKIKPHLSCPSGCSLLHAAVKWECSAIIDDSTGQAKLYAEREAALLLLGSSLDVATIENGAWELNDGVFFQPALPASSYLMQCIKDATIKARRCIAETKLNKKKEKKEENLPTTFSLLPADAKAEYLLHQHCRQWYQNHHQRKLDLFCRCKPLSENATSVNQTQIQVAKAQSKLGLDFGTISSATLPPLKLTLQDACLTSEDSQEDNISGWDHLRSYTS